MIAHFRGHGREALGQRVMHGKRLAICLPDEFGKESFQQSVTLGRIGRTPTGCRYNLFELLSESSRGWQAISGPKLCKEQTVGRCHAALSARQPKRGFDRIDKGLATGFAVFPGDASGIEPSSKKIEQTLVAWRWLSDRANSCNDLTTQRRAMQQI
ncbi:hypothetical protein SAMN04488103_111108 [Gemmobacter aquatilis]|uniref:Uncharacterized protein n=1 Tax=Gemmobacter aquatilis TaxID=933059 RepID=A0A1H8LRM5_9RHOB|nr:hypothetical protein SAMN04488103_111108 [Gemmobacter aquatilis]